MNFPSNDHYENHICNCRFLTFIGLCIVNIFLQYNEQDAPISQIIYSCKTLYMFRMVFPSIIRSSKLHICLLPYVQF